MNSFICLLLVWCVQGTDSERTEIHERWLEAIELGLPAEVVHEAQALMNIDANLPKNAQALALYSRALAATGGQLQAYALLQEAQTSPADQAHIDLALARLELADDKLAGLLRRLTTKDSAAPVRYPNHADSWWLIGKARTRLGQGPAAVPFLQYFVKQWRMHPQAPSAWHMLSQSALAKRDLTAARKYRDQGQNLATWHGFHRTRRLQARAAPNEALPRLGLAQLWSSVQETARALAELEICLRLDPKLGRAWALQGELLRQQNKPEAALQSYSRALELDDSLWDARFNRAMLYLSAEQDEVARQDLEQLVDGPESRTPRYLPAHLHLARLLKRLGQTDGAQTRFDTYRELGGKESF
jgi:Tfp pilus assembly protein PilF